jgi:hypothetical protein
VRDIQGLGVAETIEGASVHLALKPGDHVKPIRHSHDRPGYIIARGNDACAAAAICDSALRQIEIVTEDGG